MITFDDQKRSFDTPHDKPGLGTDASETDETGVPSFFATSGLSRECRRFGCS
jgi:hypothetical protein